MSAGQVGREKRRDRREHAWDRYWTEVHRGGHDHPGEFTRWAVPFLRSANARNVVDLGCGPARDLSFLLEQGFSVTGVDSSAVTTELAAKAISRLNPDLRGRGCAINDNLLDYLVRLEPASVDAVHAAATYQGLTDREVSALFYQVHRVLVTGGLHLWSVRTGSTRRILARNSFHRTSPDWGSQCRIASSRSKTFPGFAETGLSG